MFCIACSPTCSFCFVILSNVSKFVSNAVMLGFVVVIPCEAANLRTIDLASNQLKDRFWAQQLISQKSPAKN